jgi:hypothetical protein
MQTPEDGQRSTLAASEPGAPKPREWGDSSGSRFATPWVTDTEIARGSADEDPRPSLIIGSRVGSPAPPRPAVARVLHRRDDPMGARLERAGGMGPFVRIDSDDDHERPPAQTRRRGAGPRTTCRLPAPVEGTPPIESGHSPRHRPTRQSLAEPTRTRQAVHEPSRSMPQRDARSPSPARPVHLIQVGGSVSALAAWHTSHGSLA